MDYTSDIQRLFHNDKEKYLFHIHGCVSNPDSIVISPEKYDELYSDEQFDNKMKTFSSSYSFLFLGFSFSDTFVKELLKNHKEFFKGTHYLLTGNNQIDQNMIIKLRDQYGIKIIKYDVSNSTHVKEIRKLLTEITEEKPNLMSPYKINPAIGLEGLEKIQTHENNLFYRKLEIANIGEKMIKLSRMFYLAAEIFIRNCKNLGLPKEFIDGILGEIFMTYQEKYIEI
ncbi:SIR2 family protein [Jeotgalicoccus sp. WY2]|uniref:SIR2 family NAD-dependent protein deacylase n=1 Tax=Jeotgalicoccus sp. WY2 TaxID=2708346 RepID=UPI001BD27B4E|nr:SIR2 family protein [Jeotgalicoccus sp. WY2]